MEEELKDVVQEVGPAYATLSSRFSPCSQLREWVENTMANP